MKKISIVLFSIFITLSASAQKVVFRPVVPVGPRIVYYQPYFFWHPYYGFYNRWYYRQPANYYHHLTNLDKQILNIEDEYADRISSVRADDSLTNHQRRVKIRALKHERDQAILDAKANYYKLYEN